MSAKASSFNKLKGLTNPQNTPSNPDQAAATRAMLSTSRLEGALEVRIALVVPSQLQIRTEFDQEELEELAADIRERGILQPLVVRTNQDNNYEIIAGERRYRAARLAGLEKVPVLVKEMDDQKARLSMLVENIQRKNLSEEDERHFFQELQANHNLSITEIAGVINKSRAYVSKRLSGKTPENTTLEESENPVTDSEENHKTSQRDKLRKKSQTDTGAPIKFKPAAFKRAAKTLDDTLLLLGQKPDQETVEQIRESMALMEEKFQALRQMLEGL